MKLSKKVFNQFMLQNYDMKQLKATLTANIDQQGSKSVEVILEIPDSNTKKYT